jgi:hypothetical protein
MTPTLHDMEEAAARRALEAAATWCQYWADNYSAASREAKAKKQRKEHRDFESMGMACAFRVADIRAIDPAQFRSDRDG